MARSFELKPFVLGGAPSPPICSGLGSRGAQTRSPDHIVLLPEHSINQFRGKATAVPIIARGGRPVPLQVGPWSDPKPIRPFLFGSSVSFLGLVPSFLFAESFVRGPGLPPLPPPGPPRGVTWLVAGGLWGGALTPGGASSSGAPPPLMWRHGFVGGRWRGGGPPAAAPG